MDKDHVYEYIYLSWETDDKGKPLVKETGFHSYNQLLREIQERLLEG